MKIEKRLEEMQQAHQKFFEQDNENELPYYHLANMEMMKEFNLLKLKTLNKIIKQSGENDNDKYFI